MKKKLRKGHNQSEVIRTTNILNELSKEDIKNIISKFINGGRSIRDTFKFEKDQQGNKFMLSKNKEGQTIKIPIELVKESVKNISV